ncbi:hypothetical protein EMCRGX_G007303 [Ephydatia muelleri]
MSNTSGSLLKQVLIPFLIAVSNKICIKKEQDNLFTGANMYEELISSLSTDNDLVLSCGKEKTIPIHVVAMKNGRNAMVLHEAATELVSQLTKDGEERMIMKKNENNENPVKNMD